jgi:putative transposase
LREKARWLIGRFGVSSRKACGAIGIPRSTYNYRSRRPDQTPLRLRLRELAEARRRYGYRRLTILLQREGWAVNHKRVYKLYQRENLGVRTKKRKKRASHLRIVPQAPT